MNIRHIRVKSQFLHLYFGNMICLVLTGGNQERLWFNVSLKEDG